MMNIEIFTLYALIICTGLLLAAACIAILRFQRMFLESKDFWHSPTGTAIQDTESVASRQREAILESRLLALQKIVDDLSHRQSAREAVSSTRELPVENAVRMAKQGASIEDLTRSCGLNVGEAQLIRRMHARALN